MLYLRRICHRALLMHEQGFYPRNKNEQDSLRVIMRRDILLRMPGVLPSQKANVPKVQGLYQIFKKCVQKTSNKLL